jgi:predicted nucleotidyltransferase
MSNFDSKKIEILKKYFQKEPSVILAFLFGSFAKGRGLAESDFDIAVYLKDKKKEEDIWFEITKILEKSVDLVSLKEAPAILVSNIFKTGIPLVIKDKKIYWQLYLKKSTEAEDFLKFLEDFWKIKKRAKSLSEEEKSWLIIRFDYLKMELEELERFKKLSWQEYLKDKDKRRLIERWTENILNATIDIAKLILASEKKKYQKIIEIPKNYEQAIFNFSLYIGFNEKEAKNFSKLANLRNILAYRNLNSDTKEGGRGRRILPRVGKQGGRRPTVRNRGFLKNRSEANEVSARASEASERELMFAHEYLDILYSRIQNFIKVYPLFYKKNF